MNACRICGRAGGDTRYTVPENMFGTREVYPYFECAACGCLQIETVPDDPSRHYPSTYYSFGAPKVPARTFRQKLRHKLSSRWAYQGRAGPIARRLYRKAPPSPELRLMRDLGIRWGDRILDVGCGNGQRVVDLVYAGFGRAEGVDPFISADVVVDGIAVARKKALHEVDGRFRLVMFHHVLEHLADQHGTLKAAAERLAPDGVMLVRIPTVSSYAWEHYRQNWIQIDAPRHFYLHSRKSLDLLAASAGLSVPRVEYDSTDFQFWGSEQSRRGIPLVRPDAPNEWDAGLFSEREKAALVERARQLNAERRGDQLVAILRR